MKKINDLDYEELTLEAIIAKTWTERCKTMFWATMVFGWLTLGIAGALIEWANLPTLGNIIGISARVVMFLAIIPLTLQIIFFIRGRKCFTLREQIKQQP